MCNLPATLRIWQNRSRMAMTTDKLPSLYGPATLLVYHGQPLPPDSLARTPYQPLSQTASRLQASNHAAMPLASYPNTHTPYEVLQNRKTGQQSARVILPACTQKRFSKTSLTPAQPAVWQCLWDTTNLIYVTALFENLFTPRLHLLCRSTVSSYLRYHLPTLGILLHCVNALRTNRIMLIATCFPSSPLVNEGINLHSSVVQDGFRSPYWDGLFTAPHHDSRRRQILTPQCPKKQTLHPVKRKGTFRTSRLNMRSRACASSITQTCLIVHKIYSQINSVNASGCAKSARFLHRRRLPPCLSPLWIETSRLDNAAGDVGSLMTAWFACGTVERNRLPSSCLQQSPMAPGCHVDSL